MAGDAPSQPLSERAPKPGVSALLPSALAMAVVAGVGEAMVRYARSADAIDAQGLSLAVYANVAALGLIALGFAAVGYVLRRIATAVVPVEPNEVHRLFNSLLVGGLVVALAAVTEGMALARPWTPVATVVTLVAALSVFAVMYFRREGGVTSLSRLARWGAVAAWSFCLCATWVSISHTSSYLDEWCSRGLRAHTDTPADDTPNIVLVVLDTLRADRVGVYGGGGLTPNLDALAETSVVYTKALATAPWTLPTHASLFTGLYPDRHGVSWGNYHLKEDTPVLASLLKDRGYETVAISNNWLLSEENGFARGFDAFIETPRDPFLSRWRLALRCSLLRSCASRRGLSPDAGFDAGGAWTNWLVRQRLARRPMPGSPMLMFVNYFEPHDPYRPPERYLSSHLSPEERAAYRVLHQSEQKLAAQACGIPDAISEDQIALMSKLYDAEVAYQDELVGELLQVLEDSGLLENSWLVVTSDHGELFGERGAVYHTASSHFKLLHVPLIVRPPGGTAGRVVDAPVQPVDIFVTLVEEAGAVVPPGVQRAHRLPLQADDPVGRKVCVAQTHGASIAGLAMAQRVSMQTDLSHWLTWVDSIYDGRYLLESLRDGPRALFDVTVDPAMENNRLDDLRGVARSLQTRLRHWSGNENENEGDSSWSAARRVDRGW